MKSIQSAATTALAGALLLWLAEPSGQTADAKTSRSSANVVVNSDSDREKNVIVKVIADQDIEGVPAKDRTWLGVGVEEASEALVEQLGLDPGVGLVVSHVSPDSPAAKAGLKKNDVLAELDGQWLVHPAQLRKLVQARKPGDKVKLVLYRGGKKRTDSAALDQAPARLSLLEDGGADGPLRELHRKLLELPHSEALHAQAKALHDSLRDVPGKIRTEIETDIRRGLDQARKAIAETARELGQKKESLRAEGSRLKELLKSGISLDDNATVIIRSKGKSSRSLVKTDDSGTIIIIGPPNLHLTARDKTGTLIFEGEIETPDQREKVPADLWKRVEPLLSPAENPEPKQTQP